MSDLRAMGADISGHNASFTSRGNLDFIVLRATVGTSEDARFQLYLPEASKVPVRGAYHYLVSSVPWEAQLQKFLTVIQGVDLHFVALDFEEKNNTLDRAFAQATLRWLDAISAVAEKPVLLYTNPRSWNEGLQPFLNADERARLAAYELWVAQWPTHPDEAAARSTQQPSLATSMLHWTFWQFSADHPTHPHRGAEFGVGSSRVDLDIFNGTREALLQRFLGHAAPMDVTPVGEIPQVTNQEMINVFAGAFGQDKFWAVIVRAGLTAMALPPGNRPKPFGGPPTEQMTNLTDAEKAALQAALKEVLEHRTEQPGTQFLKWDAHALPGLHGPADPGGGWVPEAYEVVRESKVRAVKMLAPDLQPSEVNRLREIDPNMFIMARLFSNQLHERRGDGTPEGAGRWLANEVADPGDGNNPMNRAFNSNIRYFEVHNEPNLVTEGQGTNWQDGAEFARFFNAVVDQLRPRYQNAKFGFPGLSPGPAGGVRAIEMWAFLDQAQAALSRADFICCHVYWGGDGSDLQSAVNELRKVCLKFPDKLILCSEFSHNHADVPREEKAAQYARFYGACQSLPSNLGAMFAYALSWRADDHREGFLELQGNQWKPTIMATRLGSLIGI